MYHSSNKNWNDIDFDAKFDDVICLRRGKFFVVDSRGRAFMVASSYEVTLVADLVDNGDRYFLVESGRDLLLVSVCLGVCLKNDRFKVFRLDEELNCWEEMNLGDRMIYLGENCTFSVSASQINFKWCKGGCILFAEKIYCCRGEEEEEEEDEDEDEDEQRVWKSKGVGVFDLGTSRIGPKREFVGLSELFWSPLDCICPKPKLEDPTPKELIYTGPILEELEEFEEMLTNLSIESWPYESV